MSKITTALLASAIAFCGVSTTPASAKTTTPIVLSAMLRCAPQVDHGIIAGIISRETSTSPYDTITATSSNLWQINDNTLHRSATFRDYPTAAAVTSDLVYREHHTVAIGIGQILSDNIIAYHVTVADAFLPCTNLSLAQHVLAWAYVYAIQSLHIPPGLDATHVALQIYYAGLRNAAYTYPDAVDYANDVMNRAARFNATYARNALPTLASLPMPEHSWPSGANRIPIASTAPAAPPPPPHPLTVNRTLTNADQQQRRLNALFHE